MTDPIQDAGDTASRLDAILRAITKPKVGFCHVCAAISVPLAIASLGIAYSALQMAILAERSEAASVKALGMRDERIERIESRVNAAKTSHLETLRLMKEMNQAYRLKERNGNP